MNKAEKIKTFVGAGLRATLMVPMMGLVAHGAGFLTDDVIDDYSVVNRFECAYKFNVPNERRHYIIVSEYNGAVNVPAERPTPYLASPWATYPAHVLMFILAGRAAVNSRKKEEEFDTQYPWAKTLNGRGR